MPKKLTITLEDRVYDGLHDLVGPGRISQFIETLVRPHVLDTDLDAAYLRMAGDEAREAEAADWVDGTASDPSMRRGEVWWVEFAGSTGGEVQKGRPAVIVNIDASNAHLNRVQVVPLTSIVDRLYPSEAFVLVKGKKHKAMADQLATVRKLRLSNRVSRLSKADLHGVDQAIRIQLGLVP